MIESKAVLFSEMTPAPEWEADFNDWYDTEHIPARMRAPGFASAHRYRNVDGPAYLAVYEMQSVQTLSTPEYKVIKGSPSERSRRMLGDVSGFTRYIGEEIGSVVNPGFQGCAIDAPILYAVFFEVPEERADEFNAWYEEDHVPTLLECAEWIAVRRFRIIDGEPGNFTHLALHYLADTNALSSSAREKARASAWREKLAAEPWFKGHYAVFSKVGTRFVHED
jgi:hypothetical protein